MEMGVSEMLIYSAFENIYREYQICCVIFHILINYIMLYPTTYCQEVYSPAELQCITVTKNVFLNRVYNTMQ